MERGDGHEIPPLVEVLLIILSGGGGEYLLFPKNVAPDKTSIFIPAVGHTLKNIYAVYIGLDEGEKKKTQYCVVRGMDTGRVGGRRI